MAQMTARPLTKYDYSQLPEQGPQYQLIKLFSEARRRFLTEKGAEGAPDLVVEILSPKTAHLDLDQKRVVYARAGVDELWVVDRREKKSGYTIFAKIRIYQKSF